MAKRVFELPIQYEPILERLLNPLGHSLREPRKLANAVLQLSDFYTQNGDASTPWNEPWAKAASLAYYFPLNHARARAVAIEGQRLGFFEGLTRLLDFGSGMGAAALGFADQRAIEGAVEGIAASQTIIALDIDQDALDLGRQLAPDILDWETLLAGDNSAQSGREIQTCLLASYVLTELEEIPPQWENFEALAIIEPSTREDGRRLMELRSTLMGKGYRLWAPCPHENECPLLVGSPRDWCHDRIHWQAPGWFLEMERHLPMKNRTLTFSYLLVRRSSPPSSLQRLARLVGDRLEEKGKTRQALCRGPEREFLSWFPQRMKNNARGLDLERGHLVELNSNLEKKSDEVRLRQETDLKEIGSRQLIS